MRNRAWSIPVLYLGAAVLPLSAADDTAGIDVRSTGYFMVDGGYISETEDTDPRTWRNEPFGSLTGGLRLTSQVNERLRLTLNPELKSYNIFPIRPGEAPAETEQRTRYNIYLEEAKASWTFGDAANPRGGLEYGYLMHTDNPETKVLGNYLFRSMIYPALLFTKMDNTAAYLLGLHGNMNFLGGAFKNHLFLLNEIQNYPFFDFHLAYSGSYSFRNLFEVGAGIKYNSILPVRPSRTTPLIGGQEDNTYKSVPFQGPTAIKNAAGATIKTITIAPLGADSALVTIVDSAGTSEEIRLPSTGGGIAGLSTGRLANTALAQMTAISDKGELYPELGGTSTPYSYSGIILGGRFSFNPMAFAGETNPLGRGALKVYAEIAVLGWKDYPGFYEKRRERMPIMAGINLPTFDYLDFLSLEVEQFTSTELPTYDNRAYNNVPQPGTHKGSLEKEWDADRRAKDDIKWVLSARKSFNRWGLVFQGGTDHTKLIDKSETAVYDVMSRPSQWYAQVRVFAGLY